jgi:outer membrane protein assembly factor BamB
MAKGPNATPLVADGRLFTFGVTGVLTAWDARTGRQLWRKDYSTMIDTSKLFCGSSASPLLVDGLLIVQVGSDVHGGQIVALDPATGAARWEWKGPGPGYASPVLIDVAGTRQIVTMTDRSVVGVDARDGSQLWSIPFTDEWHENIVTPIWTGTHLIVSGTRQGTHAYTLARNGGTWRATQGWASRDVSMYMSTPVLGDGVLYGLSDKRKGYFFALDPQTGTIKWATQGREAAHASVLLTPRHLLFLTSGGELVVARRGASSFDEERKYTVTNAETWAVPVLLRTGLLVRDATSLIRLALQP